MNPNGSLTIIEGKDKGLTLDAGTWQKRGKDGAVREFPRASTGTSSTRPDRINKTGGFSERNTKPAADDVD